jgi:hypothetical protein
MPRFDVNSYVPVQDRINKFWEENPDGAIITELMSPPDNFGKVRFAAAVYKHRDDAKPSATGYAYEVAGTSERDGANFGSHEENAETSAIGRAFANMGYATSSADRPSREEMDKANRYQSGTSSAPPSAPQPIVNESTGEILPIRMSPAQRNWIFGSPGDSRPGLGEQQGWTNDDLMAILSGGIEGVPEFRNASEFIDWLKANHA